MKRFFCLVVLIVIIPLSGCHTASTEKSAASGTAVLQGKYPHEEIVLSGSVSPRLKKLHIHLLIPPEYKLLYEANPSAVLIASDLKTMHFSIKSEDQTFAIRERVSPGDLKVLLNLFLCREGDSGMCLMKEVLFKATVADTSSIDELNLSYAINPMEDDK